MADEMKCPFCGGIHGDACPEFADFPDVEGSMEDLLDIARIWRCSGMCGKVEQARTAEELLGEGWIFTSKDGFTWASCPGCGTLEQRRLEQAVARWSRAGHPRGDN